MTVNEVIAAIANEQIRAMKKIYMGNNDNGHQ